MNEPVFALCKPRILTLAYWIWIFVFLEIKPVFATYCMIVSIWFRKIWNSFSCIIVYVSMVMSTYSNTYFDPGKSFPQIYCMLYRWFVILTLVRLHKRFYVMWKNFKIYSKFCGLKRYKHKCLLNIFKDRHQLHR